MIGYLPWEPHNLRFYLKTFHVSWLEGVQWYSLGGGFIFFKYSPLFGEDEPILTFAYFSDGLVKNHQAVNYPFWKCSRTVSFEKELKTSMNWCGSGSDWTSQPVSVFYYPCCAATYVDKMCFCRKWTAGNPKMEVVEVDGRWLSFSSLDDFWGSCGSFSGVCMHRFCSGILLQRLLVKQLSFLKFYFQLPGHRIYALWTWHDFLLMKKLCSKVLCSKSFFYSTEIDQT